MKKLERTKNASRNIVFGSCLKIYQMAVPFVLRTLMIYYMGIEYVGLNSLFSSILQVLNLAELGVSSAMVFAMYRPIAENDKETICALMRLYKKYYRMIGIVILAAGVVLLPFIPQLIKGAVPSDINIYALYGMYLGNTVLSYWLFAYKSSLLTAHQRNDIISKITITTSTVQYLLQALVLICLRNYYVYLSISLAVQIITNVVTALVSTKKYPEYIAKGNLPKTKTKDINQKIKDLFTLKLGAVVLNSVDSIVISAFLGLTQLAIYNNYYYILNAVIGFITILFNSCTAGLGNSFITETKEKNYNVFEKLTFMIAWLCGICTCCFLCLYQPFMEIWVGKQYMLAFTAVIFLCIYFYVFEVNQLLNTFKDAAGIWHEDRFRPLVTACTNLCLNIILVKVIGIYGVILSTAVSILFVGMPWILHNLFKYVFVGFSIKLYVRKLLQYTGATFLACALSCFATKFMKAGIIFLGLRMLLCLMISSVVFWMLFHKRKEYLEMFELIERMTKGKIKLSRK